jgi:exodeoxyribonuclease VII small subunit
MSAHSASSPASPASVEAMSFEAAMAELERIVGQLEKGDVKLEDSIALYERGAALKARCETLLKDAEARIERIRLNADGKPTGLAPLDA